MAKTYTATYTLLDRDEVVVAEGFASYDTAQDWINDSLDYWAGMWGDFRHTAEITAN